MTRAELETTARIKRDTLRGLLDEMTDTPPRQKRKRLFGHVAALLPPLERVRFPRSTTPPPLGRGANPSMTRAEQKAAQMLADARAKLDRGDEQPVFDHPIVTSSNRQEMRMLPLEVPLGLTEEPSWDAPPPIEMAQDGEPVPRPNVIALVAIFVGAFCVGLLGAYLVI